MVGIYCAVDTCWGSTASKHTFPNPNKNNDLFNKWVKLCQNKRLLEMEPKKIYTNCRVCRLHFTEEDFERNNRLKRKAYPTKSLPGCEDTSISQTLPESDVDIVNVFVADDHDYISKPISLVQPVPSTSSSQDEIILNAPLTERCVTPKNVYRRKSNILLSIGLTRQAQLTPKKKSLYKQLTNLRKINFHLNLRKSNLKKRLFMATKFYKKNSFENLVHDLKPIQKRFFECQLENANKKTKGRRYTENDKVFALALLKQTGSAYKYLSNIFSLPSRQTILKFLSKITIRPGFNNVIFDALKAESKNFKNDLDKYVMLILDEMSILTHLGYNRKDDKIVGFDTTETDSSEFANHAQVFMVRGIRQRWKQPILFNFHAGPAKSLYIANTIKTLVKKLKEAGFIVCSVICDQGTNNCAALSSLVKQTREEKLRRGEEMDISEFFFEVDGQKIIPLFDPPHLIKCVRNNLLKNNLVYFSNGKKKIAKWNHLVTAYKMDPYFGSLRSMPKLTDFHVLPEKIQKMRVSLCTQAMSRTVAVAINLMACSETTVQVDGEVLKMEKEAVDTAELFEFFDNLFDSLNSVGRSPKSLRRPVRENSPHFQFWEEAIKKLRKMEFVNENNKSIRPPCLNNFIKTIKNFNGLFQLLRGYGFEFMKTRQFNQDPLENFFGQMRQHGGRYVNPTCEAFTFFFKSLLIKHLSSKHSSGSNCEDDKNEMFLSLKNLLKDSQNNEEDLGFGEPHLEIYFPEPNEIQFIESQALSYVLGFLLKKVKPVLIKCKMCREKLFTNSPGKDHTFVSKKEYNANSRSLIYVHPNFKKQLCSIYIGTKTYFNNNLSKNNIISSLRLSINKKVFTCDKHIHFNRIVVNKFINVNLFNYIKQINNILNLKDSRKLTATAPKIFVKARNVALKKFHKKMIKY